MVGENLQDHLEFYVQYLMLARRMGSWEATKSVCLASWNQRVFNWSVNNGYTMIMIDDRHVYQIISNITISSPFQMKRDQHLPQLPHFIGVGLSQEPVALLPVPLGCHNSWLGPSLQIRLPAAVACYPSGYLVDAGGERHRLFQPLRSGWLHQVQGKYAAPGFAVPLHPRHRHRRGLTLDPCNREGHHKDLVFNKSVAQSIDR